MSRGRQLVLALLALATAGGAFWVVITAARAGALSGQVFFAILPLAMLFGLAWRGLRGKRD